MVWHCSIHNWQIIVSINSSNKKKKERRVVCNYRDQRFLMEKSWKENRRTRNYKHNKRESPNKTQKERRKKERKGTFCLPSLVILQEFWEFYLFKIKRKNRESTEILLCLWEKLIYSVCLSPSVNVYDIQRVKENCEIIIKWRSWVRTRF
jgi:hypothetical protein